MLREPSRLNLAHGPRFLWAEVAPNCVLDVAAASETGLSFLWRPGPCPTPLQTPGLGFARHRWETWACAPVTLARPGPALGVRSRAARQGTSSPRAAPSSPASRPTRCCCPAALGLEPASSGPCDFCHSQDCPRRGLSDCRLSRQGSWCSSLSTAWGQRVAHSV